MTRMTSNSRRYDAVVVGARCAGAATAMLLARAGARVLLVDRQKLGSDTLSTHALMRPAVALLNQWGLLDAVRTSGAPPIRRTTFYYGDETLPIDMAPEGGVDALYAPRRTVLDRVLAEAAAGAGAEMRHQTSLVELTKGRLGRVTGARLKSADGRAFDVQADLVIGADGRNSSVARMTGAEMMVLAEHCTSAVYGHFDGFNPEGYHWMYRPGSSIGLIPTNDGACVFASVPNWAFRSTFGGDALRGFLRTVTGFDPRLAASLLSRAAGTRLVRFPGAPGFIRRSSGPGWALVGDASYFKDPLTAHGITDAFRDAQLLSRAVLGGEAGGLARWQNERDALSMPLFTITDAIASFDWTMDELKAHHIALNKTMRAELEHLEMQRGEAKLAA